MMRLKVAKVGEGLHPTEIVVAVPTTSGPQQLFVDADALYPDSTLNVGWPVGQDKEGNFLVELPNETTNGSWRVWVRKQDLEHHEDKRRAAG
jgi:hypothetical protein